MVIETLRTNGILGGDSTSLTIKSGDSEVEMVDLIVDMFRDNALIQIVSDVMAFNEVGGHPVSRNVVMLPPAVKKLKMDLVREETTEFLTAMEGDDLEEERDGFADIIYVLVGASLARGYAGQVSDDWKEVQKSNMSKYCKSEIEARDTVARYKRNVHDCHYVKSQLDGMFVVISDDDATKGKILKSHLYHPVAFTKEVKSLF